MTDTERDALYGTLCHTMTALGEAQAPLFLARLVLLALEALADAAAGERLIDAAAAGLAPPP